LDPFSALNLVFLIPLSVGLLFAVGAALGIGSDGGHDGDHDFELGGVHDAALELGSHVDVDADGDHIYPSSTALDTTVEMRRSLPLWVRLLILLGIRILTARRFVRYHGFPIKTSPLLRRFLLSVRQCKNPPQASGSSSSLV